MSSSTPRRVGVLFGGRSAEHEVSLASACNVMEALEQAGHTVVPIGITEEGRWLTRDDALARLTARVERRRLRAADPDPTVQGAVLQPGQQDGAALLPAGQGEDSLPTVDIIFPVLHGPFGEDGTVQGLLEMANLPYVGCGVLSSALGMDKAVSKQIFAHAGLPQTPYRVALRRAWQSRPELLLDQLEAGLTYPLFVKPANMGSSIGVSKVRDRQGLARAVDLACEYDHKVIVEQGVPGAREIEVSVLGNDDPVASVPGEIVPGNEFYDYAAKYLDDNSELLIPAPIDAGLTAQVQRMAIRAFQALDGSGLARVDFLLSREGVLYLNEVNTMPGFTRISMYPKLWAASGISYPELVDRLVQLGFERHRERRQNRVDRG